MRQTDENQETKLTRRLKLLHFTEDSTYNIFPNDNLILSILSCRHLNIFNSLLTKIFPSSH